MVLHKLIKAVLKTRSHRNVEEEVHAASVDESGCTETANIAPEASSGDSSTEYNTAEAAAGTAAAAADSKYRRTRKAGTRKLGPPQVVQKVLWVVYPVLLLLVVYYSYIQYQQYLEVMNAAAEAGAGEISLIDYVWGGPQYTAAAEFDGSRSLRSTLCSATIESGCPHASKPPALAVLYALGSLYLFVAIAIVCDEFFVPALEEIGMRWDISDDVAGATLMAAGGSAPELATSLIGTFSGSDVGFGTIVGSAVFNVLFVISCCVIFTPSEFAPLELTAWPLARDCTYYIFSLIWVASFFGLISPGIIEGWEAAVLFALYLGYCTIMAYNETMYDYFVGKKIETEATKKDEERARSQSLCFPSRYRSGFVNMVTQGGSMLDTAGVNVVFKIKGDVKTVFDKIDVDKSGTLDRAEIRKLLSMLYDDAHVEGAEATDEEVQEVMQELDLDKNGLIDFSEFTVWYVKSEQRLYHEEKKIFDEMDTDKTGTIRVSQLESILNRLQAHKQHHPEILEEAKKRFSTPEEGEDGRIPWEEFHEWFRDTEFWRDKKHDAEVAAESAEGIWGDLLDFPKEDSYRANVVYLIMAPITWTLALTVGIKDVRIPGNEGWCYFQFFASVAWIGGYSWLLVDWITTVGATLGIPAVVMGLTFLAAGTSVPDLLSSVVVAKQGKGDMAVSSSIGSNIFDITVGLPVPWMLFNIVMDCPVIVGADNLFISLVVLLLMVLSVILTIMVAGWKMNHALGAAMMMLYVIFLMQDVIRVFLTSSVSC